MPDGLSSSRLEDLQMRWQQDPNSRVYLQLAEEYRKLDRHPEAIDVLRRGLRSRPNDLSGQVALGRCHLEMEEYDAAAQALEVVVGRDPTHIVGNKLLLDCYLNAGDATKAGERLDLYKLLNSSDPDLSEFEARMRSLRQAAQAAPAPQPTGLEPGAVTTAGIPTLPTVTPPPDPAEVAFPESPPEVAPPVPEPVFEEAVFEEAAPPEPVFEEAVFEEAAPPEPVFEEAVFGEAAPPEPVFEETAPPEPAPVFEEAAPPEPVFEETAPPEPEPVFEELSPPAPESVFDEPALPESEEPAPAAGDDIFDLGPSAPAPSFDQLFDLGPSAPTPSLDDLWGEPAEEPPGPFEAVEDVAVPEPLEEVTAPEPVEQAAAPEPAFELAAPEPVEEVAVPEPAFELAPEPVEPAFEPAAPELPEEVAVSEPAEEAESDEEADADSSEPEPATATLGELYLKQGYVEEAERIFRQVLQQNPRNTAALAGLARIRGETGLTAHALLAEAGEEVPAGLTVKKIRVLEAYVKHLRQASGEIHVR